MADTFYFYKPKSSGSSAASTIRPSRVRLMLTIVALVTLCISTVCGTGLWLLFRLYQTLPTVDELESMQPSLASKVLARDGSVVYEFGFERRSWVPLEKMPADLINAVVAIEDRRFYDHWGIDLRRIFGAIVVDLVHREYAQGASTLTQQLARNVYLSAHQSLVRKVREILTSMQIESHFTKREILELYLNQVYFGAGGYGVEVASQQYFSKPVSNLNLNECAMLAGTIQRPEYYRTDKPKNLARARMRRNAVARALLDMKSITPAQQKQLLADIVPSDPQQLASKKAPYFVDVIRQHLIDQYGEDIVYNGGLTIYSTLDPVGQDSAEIAATRHLHKLQKRLNRMFMADSKMAKNLGMPSDSVAAHFDSLYELNKNDYANLPDSLKLRIAQCAVMAIEVNTGGVLTFIGGRDFSESKFNRAMQAARQPGSSFKPIVYTTAIDNGFTPATVVFDQPVTINTPQGDWRPQNFDNEFLGPIPLRVALRRSLNLPAIQVFMEVGGEKVVDMAHRMGISKALSAVPSLAIGSCEVLPSELIRAYTAFPNFGNIVEPYFIEKIVDKNGKVLEKAHPTERNVLTPQTAFIMCDLMSDVVRRGTAASIPGLGFTRPAGGKTGTTNDYSDAWFIGFTPQIVCGVWVGIDERRSLGSGVTGSEGAIPIWVPTMKGLHRNLPIENFHRPQGVVVENVCDKTHKIARPACPAVSTEYFKEDVVPDSCDIHFGRGVRRTGNLDTRLGSSQTRTNVKAGGGKKKRLTF